MKKVLATLMAAALAVSMTACAVPAPAASAPAAAPAEEAAAEAPAAPAAEGETTLTMWCIATESDANRPAYEQAIAEYEAAHPGIKIEWEAFENQSYKTKIKAAMSDPDSLPDIFFTWAGAFLGDFVDAGNVYCLDDTYKTFADQLPEVMMQNASYGGSHYGVPLTMNIVTLFANMDLLAEAGWDHVPETYEDLTACCDALVEKGITPFGCAGKETWCVTEYLEPIIEKTIGYEALNEVFAGRATWNDPGIAESVSTFQDMINKGYFDPNGMALGNDEVKANFIAGKYAFYQNGSWNCGEVNDAEGNFQVALFPVMDSSKATYGQVIGGPSDTLAVSGSSKNAELAANAAFELGRGICHYGYLAGSGLPAWTPDYDTSEVKKLVADVAEIVANSEGMTLFGDTAMSADPANTYLDYVSQVYGCEIDGQGFIEGLANDLQ
ncbi:MAG: extracellular solute-binding protein [Lachnospiraceae bacterium]|nr:extracellular solute-binding protein [Lachnospiraceae bacterium]